MCPKINKRIRDNNNGLRSKRNMNIKLAKPLHKIQTYMSLRDNWLEPHVLIYCYCPLIFHPYHYQLNGTYISGNIPLSLSCFSTDPIL